MNAELPTPWADTMAMATYFGVSKSYFLKLKKRWIQEGRMKEGKHYRVFGRRCVRYDYAEMHKLAHSRGRIVPKPPPHQEAPD